MNYVEPIRNMDDIQMISEYLKEWDERNYMLFLIGINTGLRVSDLINMKVSDVRGWYIVLRERKTKKVVKRKMSGKLHREVSKYIKGRKASDYMFKSRNGRNKPLSRQMVYIILKAAAEDCGVENVGTHSMRKTFGYHHYRKNKDIGLLMEIFNHSSQSITKRYIGIDQDAQDRTTSSFNLGFI